MFVWLACTSSALAAESDVESSTDAVAQTIESWDIEGLSAEPLVETDAHSLPHVTKSAQIEGKSVTGAKLSADYIETINISNSCLSSVADPRDLIEAVLRLMDSEGDTSGKTMYHVVLPAGSWTMSDVLCIYSNTWLDLTAGTKLVRGFNGSSLLKGNRSKNKAYGYELISNVCVQGGIWYTDTEKYAVQTTTIRFAHGHDLLVTGCTINGNYNSHMLELGGMRDVSVYDCTFKNATGTKTYKEAIQIEAVNNSSASPHYAYYDDTVCKNIIIYKNRFLKVLRGIGNHWAVRGVYCSRILIVRNTFKQIANAALSLISYRYWRVRYNTFLKCGAGIYCSALVYGYRSPQDESSTKVRPRAYGQIVDNTIFVTKRGETSHVGIQVIGLKIGTTSYRISYLKIKRNTIKSYGNCLEFSRAGHISRGANALFSKHGRKVSSWRSSFS